MKSGDAQCDRNDNEHQFEKKNQAQMFSLWRIFFTQYVDASVIAAGFHGVVQSIGFLKCPDEKGRSHTAKGTAGSPEIHIAQAGIPGSTQGIRNLEQDKDKTVDQQHQLNEQIRQMESLHYPQKVCDRCGE